MLSTRSGPTPSDGPHSRLFRPDGLRHTSSPHSGGPPWNSSVLRPELRQQIVGWSAKQQIEGRKNHLKTSRSAIRRGRVAVWAVALARAAETWITVQRNMFHDFELAHAESPLPVPLRQPGYLP